MNLCPRVLRIILNEYRKYNALYRSISVITVFVSPDHWAQIQCCQLCRESLLKIALRFWLLGMFISFQLLLVIIDSFESGVVFNTWLSKTTEMCAFCINRLCTHPTTRIPNSSVLVLFSPLLVTKNPDGNISETKTKTTGKILNIKKI